MSDSLISSIDDLRSAHPELALYLCCLPGEPVTLEVITPSGAIYRFDGPTLAEVLQIAFPPVVENDDKQIPTETINIFD